MRCVVCGSTEGVRHFEIFVEGEALRIQPDLCGEHGDRFLIFVGKLLGEMIRDGALPA